MFENYNFKNTTFEQAFIEIMNMLADAKDYDAYRFGDKMLNVHGYCINKGYVEKRRATIIAENIMREYSHKFGNMDKLYLKNNLIKIIEGSDSSEQTKNKEEK